MIQNLEIFKDAKTELPNEGAHVICINVKDGIRDECVFLEGKFLMIHGALKGYEFLFADGWKPFSDKENLN